MGIQTAPAIEDALREDIKVAGEDSEVGGGA
jgi:hypothetical protein